MSEDSRPSIKFKGLLFLALIAAVLAFVPFPLLRGVPSEARNDAAIQSNNTAEADQGQVSIDIDYIVDPVGWLAGWSYRKAITIDNANVDSDLTDFPLLVKITADADIGDGAQADGDDIRFTDSGGTTLLPYEEESWTGGAGNDATADFWVKVPTVATAADSTIYAYYGKSDAADGQDAMNVWDSNFKGVWHLPNGTTLGVLDSTSNANNGTINGVVATAGKVDGAGSFDGTNSNVDIGNKDIFDFGTSPFAVSAWFKAPSSAKKDYRTIIARSYNPGLWIQSRATGHIDFSTSDSFDVETTGDYFDNAWHHITAVRNSTAANDSKIYMDGSLDGQGTVAASASNDANLYIGSFVTIGNRVWDGTLDEVRISSAARSAAWVKFEYNNMASATNELTFGSQLTSVLTNAYWIGGTGNWSDTAHWANESGGTGGYSAPASTSNAVFDASSGTGTVTIDTASVSVTNLTQSSANIIITTGANTLNMSGIWAGGGGTVTGSGAGAVVLNGTSQSITGSTTFYNLTKTVATADTLTFTAGTTQTVSGALTLNGASGQLLSLRSSSSPTQWNIVVPATQSLSYIDVKDSNNTGTVIDATNTSLFTDSGNNVGWTFDTVAPTTTATATSGGSSHTPGVWTNENVTITLTCADNDGGIGCSTTYYCSDTTNTCTPTTTYTSAVTISTEGTSYIRYYSTDTVPNTETTASQTIKIDTTNPVTVASTIRNGNTINSTLTCTDISGSGCTYTYYCYDATNTCAPTTVYSTTVNYLITSPTYFRYYSVDALSHTDSTASELVELQGGTSGTSGSGNTAPQPVPTPVVTPAPADQPQPTVIQQIIEAPEQIVQKINEITKQLAKTPQQLAQNIQIISQKVFDVSKNIAQLIVPPFGRQPGLQGMGPLAEAVPKSAPPVFQGWDIMTARPIGEIVLSPVEFDIAFFAEKFPQFEKTLAMFGIDVNKISDVQKVSGTELYLPGLTQTILTSAEILSINKFSVAQETPFPELIEKTEEQKRLVAPGTFEINKFALAQAVPLADLTTEAKQKIPTDIVFARTGGELIDYKIGISVDKNGGVEQKIKTVLGKPIQLVIKPDQPAKRVTGFISLKKSAVGQNNQNKTLNILSFISRISGAALIDSMQDAAQPKLDQSLLVNKFAYVELKGGIFTANINAPKNEGEYQISTVIEYKDILIDPKETKMAVIVNPEGYVYSQMPDGRLRIKGASVLLYWQNPETKQYEPWPAEKFLQKNPIVTDETGKYSFLVPKGTYELKATALNYENYESDSFEMNEEIAVNQNIEMKKKSGLFGWLNWQNFVVALLIIVVVLLSVIIVFFVKRSKSVNNFVKK